jgi:hypothetical protein
LNALAIARAGMLRQGIGIADHEDYARHAPVHGMPLTDWIQDRPWESLLGRLGFPIGSHYQAPHWLAGDVIYALPDYDLTWYLREGVVLDPQAAQGLIERGWGERLGLKGVKPVNDAVNEWLTIDPLNGRFTGYALPAYNHIPVNRLFTCQFTQGRGRVLSRWVSVDGKDCGSALVLFQADEKVYGANMSWRAAFMPYSLETPTLVLLNHAHRASWSAMLAQLAGRPLPCRVSDGANLYPMTFVSPDEDRWLVAIVNLSADDVHQATLELNALNGNEWAASQLTQNGTWAGIKNIEGNHCWIDVNAFSVSVLQFTKL